LCRKYGNLDISLPYGSILSFYLEVQQVLTGGGGLNLIKIIISAKFYVKIPQDPPSKPPPASPGCKLLP
jgi:hypothetical protein